VARGHAVRVLTTCPWDGPASLWGSVAREDGVLVDRFFPANAYHLTRFREHGVLARTLYQGIDLWNPHVWARAEWVVRTWKPDVVHMHQLTGLSAALFTVARQRGIPSVATLHDHALFCVYGTLQRPNGAACPPGCVRCAPLRTANRHFTRSLCHVIGPSTYILKQHDTRSFFPVAARHVVPNGVMATKTTTCRSFPLTEAFHVVFLGRLTKEKGVDVLLDAVGEIPAARFRLSLAGDGPLRELCEDRARRDSRIVLLGTIDAAQRDQLLASAHVLVLPSTVPENFPMSIEEAQMAGLPVVASRIGGIGEMVIDGQTGFLAPPGDTAALAAALQTLYSSSQLWLRCAEGARRLAQGYAMPVFLDAIERIYRQAVQDGGRRP
jgi:glycosyltransferase involved in cell wall biosynthesis